MLQRLACYAVLCALGAGSSGWAQAASAKSGVRGQVTQSPAGPGPTRISQESDAAPVAAVTVELRDKSDTIVAKASTADDGSFALDAPDGNYVLRVDRQGIYPRCPALPVKIRKGRVATVDIRCDSGMR